MKKVNAGDALVIRAADWNQLVDAANFVAEQRQKEAGGAIASGFTEGIVRVHNTEATPLPIYTVVAISGRTPAVPDYDTEETRIPQEVYYEASLPTAENAPYAVLQEALEPDAVGRAKVFGITPVRLSGGSGQPYALPATATGTAGRMVSGESGTARILCPPTSQGWGIVMLGGGGGGGGGTRDVRLCEISTDDKNGSGAYSVNLYSLDDAGQKIGSSTLFITEIALGSPLPVGTRVLGHLVTLRATGGNE
ncbi:MAG: hypothetical protein ACI4RT_07405 [Candidatus Spyradenecus sp.]